MKNRFRYHYKKELAVFFSSIGLALLVANFIVDFVNEYQSRNISANFLLNVWNFLIFAVAYYYIFIGNLQDDNRAYRGLMIYIFAVTWGFVFSYLLNMNNFSVFLSGNAAIILLFSFMMLFLALCIISGVMTYVRTRQYLTSRYAKYEGVRWWCLAFVICNILVNGLSPAILIIEAIQEGSGSGVLSVLSICLEPISQIFISLSIFFTVTRLRSSF